MLRAALYVVLLVALPSLVHAEIHASPVSCDDAAPSPQLRDSRCMTVQVPLRHAAPEGETISLFVRRVPAATDVARRGEVWLLSGGPGEAGASLYPMLSTYQRAFPGFDLVIADHRGTGRSSRICPVQEAPDSPDGVALAGTEWGPCIGAMYANPTRTMAFSITEAAQDLGLLITSQRGSGELLVYGVSYGTQLALRALQAAPFPLDGLILDGLVPPEATQQWDLSRRTALVDEVGRQVLRGPDVATYSQLLASAPDASWRKQVPGGDLRRFYGALLSFPVLRDRIPQMTRDLSRDDARSLERTVTDWNAALAQLGQGGDNRPALPLVMLIAASENNARPELTKAMVEAEEKGKLFISPIPGLLVDSPVPPYPRDAWFGKTPTGLPKTLVVHGTLDPNTAYAGAREHAAELARTTALTFHTVDGGAHLLALVAPSCFANATRAFVEGRKVSQRCTEPKGP